MNRLLCLLVIFAIVACDSSSDDNSAKGGGRAPNPTVTDGGGDGSSPSTPAFGDNLGKGSIPSTNEGSLPVVSNPSLELVNNMVNNVVYPRVVSFTKYADELTTNTLKACSEGEVQKVSDLKKSWKLAMMEYHYLEALAFGPLGELGGALGKNIYSWPIATSGDVVDTQIQKQIDKGDKYKFKKTRLAGKGMDAFEHILYTRLNGFEELGPQSEECPYMVLITEDLAERVTLLKDQWKAELDYLKTPVGLASSKEYMSEITDSLFFADKRLKDRKLAGALAIPTSIRMPCTLGRDCQLYLEHQSSQLAKEAAVINMQAVLDALTGYSSAKGSYGFGYAAYLKNVEASSESVDFVLNAPRVLDSWSKLPNGSDFFEKVQAYDANDCGSGTLCDSFQILRSLTTWLKVDFITELSVELPGNVQGDND